MMTLFAKDGSAKLVPSCTYPLTGLACVSRVYTELAMFQVCPAGAAVIETWGTSFAELAASLAIPLRRD